MIVGLCVMFVNGDGVFMVKYICECFFVFILVEFYKLVEEYCDNEIVMWFLWEICVFYNVGYYVWCVEVEEYFVYFDNLFGVVFLVLWVVL